MEIWCRPVKIRKIKIKKNLQCHTNKLDKKNQKNKKIKKIECHMKNKIIKKIKLNIKNTMSWGL